MEVLEPQGDMISVGCGGEAGGVESDHVNGSKHLLNVPDLWYMLIYDFILSSQLWKEVARVILIAEGTAQTQLVK